MRHIGASGILPKFDGWVGPERGRSKNQEARSQKPEARSQKPEARSQKPEEQPPVQLVRFLLLTFVSEPFWLLTIEAGPSGFLLLPNPESP
jgi:hypothetical protein